MASTRRSDSRRTPIPLAFIAASVFVANSAVAGDKYFKGGGENLDGSYWATTPGGLYTNAFADGDIAHFSVSNGHAAGANLTIGGIIATEDLTIDSVSGTISNFGNGVVSIDVADGKSVNFGSQPFTSSSTAGYTKTGNGTFGLTSSSGYGGGFTLNAGAVIVRGSNALGNGGVLTLNGGTVAANATRNLAGKYAGGINIGGDVTFGGSTGQATAAANLTFSDSVSIGATTREITIGANGLYTFNGAISGTGSGGVTIKAASGATGNIVFGGANSYTGQTHVASGKLVVSGTGTINGSTSVASGATLDVTAFNPGGFSVASGRTLSGAGTVSGKPVIAGSISPDLGASLKTNDLTIGATGTFIAKVDWNNTAAAQPTGSTVEVTGGVTIASGSTLQFQFINGPTPGVVTPTRAVVLIKNDAADGVSGTFTNKTPLDGAFNNMLHYTVVTDYDAENGHAGGGNDVAVLFTSVPEPASLLSLGAAGFLLLRRRVCA